MKLRLRLLSLYFLIFAIGLIFAACSEGRKLGSYTPEELMKMALEDYEEEDYIEAKEKLQTIELQYPSSQYADDAQFYMGMVHYQREDYVLASYSFSRLEKFYPGSEFKAKAAYMAAESQYQMSPAHYRDQDYSNKAIKTFQEFQYLYPGEDSLYGLASTKIRELRNKLALKELSVAKQYDILDSPKSSLIYYDIVLDDYPDTDHYEEAFVGKIGSLIRVRRYDDALSLINIYEKKFTVPEFKNEIAELKRDAFAKKTESANQEEDED